MWRCEICSYKIYKYKPWKSVKVWSIVSLKWGRKSPNRNFSNNMEWKNYLPWLFCKPRKCTIVCCLVHMNNTWFWSFYILFLLFFFTGLSSKSPISLLISIKFHFNVTTFYVLMLLSEWKNITLITWILKGKFW